MNIGFDFYGNNFGGGVRGVRLYQVRERGSGDSQGKTPVFRNVG